MDIHLHCVTWQVYNVDVLNVWMYMSSTACTMNGLATCTFTCIHVQKSKRTIRLLTTPRTAPCTLISALFFLNKPVFECGLEWWVVTAIDTVVLASLTCLTSIRYLIASNPPCLTSHVSSFNICSKTFNTWLTLSASRWRSTTPSDWADVSLTGHITYSNINCHTTLRMHIH